jgi:hypothetical protein
MMEEAVLRTLFEDPETAPVPASAEMEQEARDRFATEILEAFDGATAARTEPNRLSPASEAADANKKGDDPSEWPEELRVRQFPEEVNRGS